ncbi:MAG: pYEATS domain-containing protein, partial [Mucilaginibacter sp.]
LKTYLIFMGYCFLAAAAGPRFINSLIDGVIKDKQINNLTEKNKAAVAEKDKAEAEKDKVVEQKAEVDKKQELQTIENRVRAGKEETQALQTASFAPIMQKSMTAATIKPQIGPITVQDDPQKGRFGGESESNGRVLKASVVESKYIPEFYNLSIWVESTDKDKPLDSDVIFYLHDSFRPAVYTIKQEDFKDGIAIDDDLLSYGAFTVGVVTDNGNTLLELDLADNPGFPEKFRKR